MTTLTITVTTRYGSQLISGRGQIKAVAAVATGHGTRTVRILAYNHGQSITLNHMDASYAAVNRAVRKLGFIMEPGNVSRRLDYNGNGETRWTYTVEV